uniref:Uncharacterized protein n=1 Tax=Sinocyclocheilus anshuiensis TaxID=1608454 RepID=A0A671R5Y8_9TELE
GTISSFTKKKSLVSRGRARVSRGRARVSRGRARVSRGQTRVIEAAFYPKLNILQLLAPRKKLHEC